MARKCKVGNREWWLSADAPEGGHPVVRADFFAVEVGRLVIDLLKEMHRAEAGVERKPLVAAKGLHRFQ